MKDLVKSSKKYLKNLKSKNVLDIGCNDETLLSYLRGCNIIWCRAYQSSYRGQKKGHIIFKEYFDKTSSKNIEEK